MRLWKVLLGAAAVGAIALAFRDFDNRRWLGPAVPGGPDARDDDEGDEEGEWVEEPVLGYDGMDRDTLVAWLDDADLDETVLLRIRRYEESNAGRDPVLDKVDDLLAAFG
ncbi:MAG TPA: hypothetical protein VHG91_12585 [Longimicrobium sp.]|nr:hypothetical protein [Longimicrobium sp.]